MLVQNALVGSVDVDGWVDVYHDTPVEGTIEQTAGNFSRLAMRFGVEDAPSKLPRGTGSSVIGHGRIDWATGLVTAEQLPAASFALLIDEDTAAIHILGYSWQRAAGEWVRIAYIPPEGAAAARGEQLHPGDAALPMVERAGKPVTVTTTVIVTAPSPAAVARVLAERLLADEDYGFDYSITYE